MDRPVKEGASVIEIREASEVAARRQASPAVRAFFIAALAVLALLVGHFGWREAHKAMVRAGMADGDPVLQPGHKALIDVPPPPDSQRFKPEGVAPDGQHAWVQYFSGRPAETTAAFYRRRMPEYGWREIDLPAVGATRDTGFVLTYSNPRGHSCIIAISEHDGGSSVSIMRVRAPEAPSRPSEPTGKETLGEK